MEPLEPRTSSRRRRRGPHQLNDDVAELETIHRLPRPDVEVRISSAIAQRSAKQGGSAVDVDGLLSAPKHNQFYEYLDHTADIQLHAWGDSFGQAMEHLLLAMFGYMTDLTHVEPNESVEPFTVTGHDRTSLVFNVLQEWLSQFHESGFVPSVFSVGDDSSQDRVAIKDGADYKVTTSGKGERFDANKHTTGTEVKAITFSNLQATQTEEDRWDIWVIVDI